MARGTSTSATTPLRLKRKGGQPRAYQLWLQSQVGEQKKDGLKERMDSQGHTSPCYSPR